MSLASVMVCWQRQTDRQKARSHWCLKCISSRLQLHGMHNKEYSKLEKLSHSAHLCHVLPSGECCSNEPIFTKYLQTTICLKNICQQLSRTFGVTLNPDRQTDKQTNANKNVTYLAEVISYNVLNSNTPFKA